MAGSHASYCEPIGFFRTTQVNVKIDAMILYLL